MPVIDEEDEEGREVLSVGWRVHQLEWSWRSVKVGIFTYGSHLPDVSNIAYIRWMDRRAGI